MKATEAIVFCFIHRYSYLCSFCFRITKRNWGNPEKHTVPGICLKCLGVWMDIQCVLGFIQFRNIFLHKSYRGNVFSCNSFISGSRGTKLVESKETHCTFVGVARSGEAPRVPQVVGNIMLKCWMMNTNKMLWPKNSTKRLSLFLFARIT